MFTKHSILIIILIIAVFFTPFFISSADNDTGIVPCGTEEKDSCKLEHFFTLIKNIINFLLTKVAVPLAAIGFAWAGWLYMTSGGDSGKTKEAKEIMLGIVIGLLIALAAWLIVSAILKGLGTKGAFNLLKE